ncbi:DEAD/DEAH box helicase [uncultured Sphingomonas sp.]|uniref:DEAD/DEAH box helicase n=1 Tax=uncultured Sphingomonas sp. TaxID=158754 RepID=UPI0025D1D226|nr:DEAD/DEAH box helicase [uncultured Sphingomonas sp.]
MLDTVPHLPVAEVRVGDALDGLYVVPRDRASAREVFAAVRVATDDGGAKRTASGTFVPMADAMSLRRTAGLDLRWSPDAVQFLENRARASQCYDSLVAELHALRERGPKAAAAAISDSDGLGTLDGHQVLNVAAMTVPSGFGLCVFDEQGAGKTVTLIYAYDLLAARDEADRVLIIAPKSMVPEWPKDFARFRGDLYRVEILSGTTKEKRAALQRGAEVLVTNFETAVSLEAELTAMFRARPGRTVLAVDESFFIKSLDAKRTRAIRRLREWCGRAFVLCGTPAPNAPQDLIGQFNLVDFGLAFDGVDVPVDRAAAAPVVQSVIDSRGLYVRHLKAQVLPDLPAKRFQRVFVPMAPRQAEIYQSLLTDLVSEAEAATEQEFKRRYTSFLARRSALLQVCSNPAAVESGYDELPAKLAALDAVLERLVEHQQEKVVVWSFYTRSVSAIVDRYARYGAMRYDGEVTDVGERREAVRRFQEDDRSMVLVANPAAAGAGLTLHRARVAVYESLSNQAAHYLQSLDRIHRRGQSRDVEYLVLLCDKTIEVQEYDRLVAKEVAAQSLLGDVVAPPVTREAFLEEARAAAALLHSVP